MHGKLSFLSTTIVFLAIYKALIFSVFYIINAYNKHPPILTESSPVFVGASSSSSSTSFPYCFSAAVWTSEPVLVSLVTASEAFVP